MLKTSTKTVFLEHRKFYSATKKKMRIKRNVLVSTTEIMKFFITLQNYLIMLFCLC